MTDPIIPLDVIKRQARSAVESGKPVTSCPYLSGTSYAKRWIAAYLMREIELEQGRAPCENRAA